MYMLIEVGGGLNGCSGGCEALFRDLAVELKVISLSVQCCSNAVLDLVFVRIQGWQNPKINCINSKI